MKLSFFISPSNYYVVHALEEPIGSSRQESETTKKESETQTTLLEQSKMTNILLIGLIIFIGIIAGLLAGKILWDRLHQ